jgi:hypothetical protein
MSFQVFGRFYSCAQTIDARYTGEGVGVVEFQFFAIFLPNQASQGPWLSHPEPLPLSPVCRLFCIPFASFCYQSVGNLLQKKIKIKQKR